jgi:hypothetical protein
MWRKYRRFILWWPWGVWVISAGYTSKNDDLHKVICRSVAFAVAGEWSLCMLILGTGIESSLLTFIILLIYLVIAGRIFLINLASRGVYID